MCLPSLRAHRARQRVHALLHLGVHPRVSERRIFMTLGEAMGPHYGPEWLTKTIIPGVKDWQKREAGGHPVPSRRSSCARTRRISTQAMAGGSPLYSNIDTMCKWNGESLTWTNIRGAVREVSECWSTSSNDDDRQHPSALQPRAVPLGRSRLHSPDARRILLRLGIGGLHVYPLRYWDWPYSARQHHAAADADRPRLDLVRSVGALRLESGARSGEGARVLGGAICRAVRIGGGGARSCWRRTSCRASARRDCCRASASPRATAKCSRWA